MPARRRAAAVDIAIGGIRPEGWSLHFEALVGESEFLHCHVGALRIHGPADVLDDARADQLPCLHDRAVVLALQMDDDISDGVLAAIANVVQPLIEVQRAYDATF